MKTYLSLKVPLRANARWLGELRSRMRGLPVNWAPGDFHLTLARLNERPDGLSDQEMTRIINWHLAEAQAPEIVFNQIDVFTNPVSGRHIIALIGTDGLPAAFGDLTRALRADLADRGCTLDAPFRPHVTLGRMPAKAMPLSELQAIGAAVNMPRFTLQPREALYRIAPRLSTIGHWTLRK